MLALVLLLAAAGVALDAERWARDIAAGEAEAVARSFAAGVAPQILAERLERAEQAVNGFRGPRWV